MNKSKVLQDAFLEQLKKENNPVSIYLINGIKLQGTIDSFDQYVVLLKSSSIVQAVYKHAISTIVPSKLIDFRTDEDNKDTKDDKDNNE